jgi:hypothetical protein
LAWLLLKLFKRQPVASTRRGWFETAKGGHGPVKPDD